VKRAMLFVALAVVVWTGGVPAAERRASGAPAVQPSQGYAGSQSCRECHEKFYQLWSTSWHGLAMQPYTEELARTRLTTQQKDVVVGKTRYRAEIGRGQGWVQETGQGGKKRYPIAHALGGKNV